MRSKMIFAAGAAVGFVLGARAGRGRYEQLKAQAGSAWKSPKVQDTISTAQETVKAKAPEVQAKVSEAASNATAAAKAKLQGGDSDSAAADLTGADSSSNLAGAEPTSDYSPSEIKYNSAD